MHGAAHPPSLRTSFLLPLSLTTETKAQMNFTPTHPTMHPPRFIPHSLPPETAKISPSHHQAKTQPCASPLSRPHPAHHLQSPPQFPHPPIPRPPHLGVIPSLARAIPGLMVWSSLCTVVVSRRPRTRAARSKQKHKHPSLSPTPNPAANRSFGAIISPP